MRQITTGFAAAALLLLTVNAQADQQKSTSTDVAKAAQARARVPDYLNVAGFKASVRDPRYAYAAVPAASVPAPAPKPPVSSFPMPFTVWW